MRYLILFLSLIMICLLVGCDDPKSSDVVSSQSMGVVQSMYCYHGDMELKTDRGFVAVALTDEFKCPVVQLNTEAFVSRFSDGKCWIYWNGRSYKCY